MVEGGIVVGGGTANEWVVDGVSGATTGGIAEGGGWYGEDTIGECWAGLP